MPFVTKPHRQHPQLEIPGDRCYIAYKAMLDHWRVSPRWTTVDTLARSIWPDDWKRADMLAFLVFFSLHVMPYEQMKQKENGDI